MAITQVLVTANFTNPNGTPAFGFATFTPTAEFSQPGQIVPAVPQVVPVLSGSMVVTLAANDDPLTTPANQGYIVTENFGPDPSTYVVIVPSGAAGGTVDLATLIPANAVGSFYDVTVSYDLTFEAAVRANRLDQMGAPTSLISMNGQRLGSLAPPQLVTDAPQALNALLGQTWYEPTTFQSRSKTTQAIAAVDTTNLSLAFTAISANTMIELTGFLATTTTDAPFWGVSLHGGGISPIGYMVAIMSGSSTGQMSQGLIRIPTTTGTSYNLDWIWGLGLAGGSLTLTFGVGTSNPPNYTLAGPGIMRAFAA